MRKTQVQIPSLWFLAQGFFEAQSPLLWASLVAQMVKNPPAMWETWARSLGQDDPPGGGHGNPLHCLENPHGQRRLKGYSPLGCRVRHDWATKHTLLFCEEGDHATDVSIQEGSWHVPVIPRPSIGGAQQAWCQCSYHLPSSSSPSIPSSVVCFCSSSSPSAFLFLILRQLWNSPSVHWWKCSASVF